MGHELIEEKRDDHAEQHVHEDARDAVRSIHTVAAGQHDDREHRSAADLAGDVETVAAYLHEHEITCALAHPFYAVEAPLTARHRRRLAEVATDLRPRVEAELAAEHERIAGGVDKAVEIGVVDEVVEPTRTRSAIAKAIDDAVQTVGVRRGQHGNIPL